jgi:hypothetical protein
MKISKLVLIASILFLLGYSCKQNTTNEVNVETQNVKKVKTYGLYFPEQDSISVNLSLDEYKTYKELIDRFQQISCSERIPKITIENDSVIRKIYFASFCDESTTPIIKNKNVIEIYDDKIYRGYGLELLPLDSANNYVEKNLKNFGKVDNLSESPDKLFFIIDSNDRSKLNKLENNLLKLIKVFDEVGGNNRLNLLIMQRELPPPPPPAPEKIDVVESKKKVTTPKKIKEVIEDEEEEVFESVISSTETDEEIVEVSEVEDVSEYKIIKEYYRSYSYKDPKKLKYVGAYDDNGERTGLWEAYSNEGKGYITSKGYYKNGKRVGHWIYYYSNGYKKAEGKLTGKLDPTYKYEKWLKTGTWIRYGEYSGKKNAEYYYDDNGNSTGNKWFN